MKAFVFFAAAILSVSGIALDKLPDGKYAGGGKYSLENGPKGTFQETLDIKDNVMTSEVRITLPNGNVEKMVNETKLTIKADGFVSVVMTDKVRNTTRNGAGFCGSIWCHIKTDDHNFETTLVVAEKQIFELGTHVESGSKVGFESALKLQP